MTHGNEERRSQPRRKDRIALVFNYAQEQRAVNTMDVSPTGALIRTPVAFPSGTLLILEAPSLCAADTGVRLLAKVVRASQHGGDPGALYSGLGLTWIRAYCARGEGHLKTFLTEVLGFPPKAEVGIGATSTGDAVYDFPASPIAGVLPVFSENTNRDEEEAYVERKNVLADRLTDLLKVDARIVYSVSNMHYRGTLIAISREQLAVMVRGALPFLGAKVSVRYPLEDSPTAPRIIIHAVTELVLEPFRQEAGVFHALVSKFEEKDSQGLFRTHLNTLESGDTERW